MPQPAEVDQNEENTARYLNLLRKHREFDRISVGKLHRAGVPILVGTDFGNPGTFVGYSLHVEMQLLEEAGLDPMTVLQGATSKAAEFLGAQRGYAVGSRADFVILDKSPLENLAHTKSISAVMLQGQLLDRRQLLPWQR